MSKGRRHKDILLNTWQEYCDYIGADQDRYEKDYCENKKQYYDKRYDDDVECMRDNPVNYYDPDQCETDLRYFKPLYRGHQCSSWKLQTTLERELENFNIKKESYPLEKYFDQIQEQITKSKIDITKKYGLPPSPDGIKQLLTANQWRDANLDDLMFMVHQRHDGYPSPLLDWTTSYNVASFYAFQNPSSEDHVAIYSFRYFHHQEQSSFIFLPKLLGLHGLKDKHKERTDSAYPRFKKQEAEVTLCLYEKKLKNSTKILIKSHENQFIQKPATVDVPYALQRILLPSSLRKEVLQYLDEEKNINAHTLYGDDNALMETLANRAMLFKD